MKSLYLDGRAKPKVYWDEVALRIERPNQATLYLPLSRVGQVVMSGGVLIDSDVLIGLLNQGVPITFLNRQGAWVGKALGRMDDSSYGRHLALLQEDSEGREQILNWKNAAERKARLAVASRLDPSICPKWKDGGVRNHEYDRWWQGCLRPEVPVARSRLLVDYLQAILESVAASRLQKSGIDPGLYVGPLIKLEPVVRLFGTALRPYLDMTVALELYARAVPLTFIKQNEKWALTNAGRRIWTAKFEAMREDWQRKIDALIGSILNFLGEALR